jgi:hypothetical protein
VSEIHGRDPDVLAAQLGVWIREYDPHVRVVVELLIDRGALLGRARSSRVRMHRHGREAQNELAAARRYADADPGGSTRKLAVLDPSVAFSEIWYRLQAMGQAGAGRMAVADAVGADR